MAVNVDAVDQVARDGVAEVRGMINMHQAVCEQQAIESQAWRGETTAKLDRIAAQIWAAALGSIGLLVVMIGYLISNKGLPG